MVFCLFLCFDRRVIVNAVSFAVASASAVSSLVHAFENVRSIAWDVGVDRWDMNRHPCIGRSDGRSVGQSVGRSLTRATLPSHPNARFNGERTRVVDGRKRKHREDDARKT